MKKILLLLVILTIVNVDNYAENTVWSSTGDESWNTAGNWSDGIPGVNDSAIFNGTSVVNCVVDANFKIHSLIGVAAYTGAFSSTYACTTTHATSMFTGGAITLSGSLTASTVGRGAINLYPSGTLTATTLNVYKMGAGQAKDTVYLKSAIDSLYCVYTGDTVLLRGNMGYLFVNGGNLNPVSTSQMSAASGWTWNQNGTYYTGTGIFTFQGATANPGKKLIFNKFENIGTAPPSFRLNNSTGADTIHFRDSLKSIKTTNSFTFYKVSTGKAVFIYDSSIAALITTGLKIGNNHATDTAHYYFGGKNNKFGTFDDSTYNAGVTMVTTTGTPTWTIHGSVKIGTNTTFSVSGMEMIIDTAANIRWNGKILSGVTLNPGAGFIDTLCDSIGGCADFNIVSGKIKGLEKGGTCSDSFTLAGSDSLFGNGPSGKFWTFPNVTRWIQTSTGVRKLDSMKLDFAGGGYIQQTDSNSIKRVRLGAGKKKLVITAGTKLKVSGGVAGDLSGTVGNPDTLMSGTAGTACTLQVTVRPVETYLYLKDVAILGDSMICTTGCVDAGGNSGIDFGDTLSSLSVDSLLVSGVRVDTLYYNDTGDIRGAFVGLDSIRHINFGAVENTVTDSSDTSIKFLLNPAVPIGNYTLIVTDGDSTDTLRDDLGDVDSIHVFGYYDTVTITFNPHDTAVGNNELVNFYVSATSTGALTYQWQFYRGASWADTVGATGTSLSFTAYSAGDGDSIRCVVTSPRGEDTTTAALLTVTTPIYTLTITNDGNGTTDPSGPVLVGEDVGTAISAIPYQWYGFVNWTVVSGTVTFANALASATACTTFTDATIRANFDIDSFYCISDGDANAVISYLGDSIGAYGEYVRAYVTVASGFIGTWNYGSGITGVDSMDIYMVENVTITATSSQNVINICILGQSNADTIGYYHDSLETIIENANEYTGVNVAYYAVGGSGLLTGSPNWSTRGAGSYISNAAATINSFDSISYIVWYQGEADAAAYVTRSAYSTALRTLFYDLLDSITVPKNNIKFLIVQPRSGYTQPQNFGFREINFELYDFCDADTFYFGANATGLPGYDAPNFIHIKPASGRQINRQLGNTINYILGTASTYLPPMVSSHSINNDRDSLYINTDRNITSIASVKGFTFKNDGDTIVPVSVSTIDSNTIVAVFDTIEGGYTIQFGIEQIANSDSAGVPRSSDFIGARLLPYQGEEIPGMRGKINYLISSYLWGKGNGNDSVYAGYMPTFSPKNYTTMFDGFTAANGHVYDGSRWITKFNKDVPTAFTTNDTLSVGGVLKHCTVCLRFKYVSTGANQVFYTQRQDASNYLALTILPGFVVEWRYTIGGAYTQARTNTKADAFVVGDEYYIECRQHPNTKMSIYIKNLTADTTVPITYSYQSDASAEFRPASGMHIGKYQTSSAYGLGSDLVYLAFFNEYMVDTSQIDDSIMSYFGYAVDTNKTLLLDAVPTIDSIISHPRRDSLLNVAWIGDTLYMYGIGYYDSAAVSDVWLNSTGSVKCDIVSWSSDMIKVIVPSGIVRGYYFMRVVNKYGEISTRADDIYDYEVVYIKVPFRP